VGLAEGFGSVVLQSGERRDEVFLAYIERLLRGLRELSAAPGGDPLLRRAERGDLPPLARPPARSRYLLRIETTNPELFAAIHPQGQDLVAARRLPGEPAPLRLSGRHRRDDRPAGPDRGRPGARRGLHARPGRRHGRHGAVHPLPRHAPGRQPRRFRRAARRSARAGPADDRLRAPRAAGHQHRRLDGPAGARPGRPGARPAGRRQRPDAQPDRAARYRRGYQLYDGKPGLDETSAASRDRLAGRWPPAASASPWARRATARASGGGRRRRPTPEIPSGGRSAALAGGGRCAYLPAGFQSQRVRQRGWPRSTSLLSAVQWGRAETEQPGRPPAAGPRRGRTARRQTAGQTGRRA
jgi:hypothetical protein